MLTALKNNLFSKLRAKYFVTSKKQKKKKKKIMSNYN